MDLLFSKYASPYIFLDDLIANGDFFNWVIEFINAENERQIWDMWVHRIFDKTYEEFRRSVLELAQPKEVTEEQIETTVADSRSILNSFVPEGVKHGTI